MNNKQANLESLELFIAKLLRWGVLFAGLLMFIGWMSQLDLHGDAFAPYHTYTNEHLYVALSRYWTAGQWGVLTAYAGLALLVSLPLIRVMATGVIFLKQKDFIMAGVVAIVLLGLLLSLSLGFTE